MSSDEYPFPVAVSQLGENDSREAQAERAVRWLLTQSGGDVVVVTPQKRLDNDTIERLVKDSRVTHQAWRGFHSSVLAGRRVIYAWWKAHQFGGATPEDMHY